MQEERCSPETGLPMGKSEREQVEALEIKYPVATRAELGL